MATQFKPTSPAADAAAWASQSRTPRSTLLTPDLMAMAQGGMAVCLGTCSKEGWPRVGTGIGCRILADGTLRVIVSRIANVELLELLSQGQPLAVTFSTPRDHRSFQVKSSSAVVRPAISDDLPEMDRQTDILRVDLIGLGFPPAVARGYVSFDAQQMVAIEFVPDRVFTQTPGPGAGGELK